MKGRKRVRKGKIKKEESRGKKKENKREKKDGDRYRQWNNKRKEPCKKIMNTKEKSWTMKEKFKWFEISTMKDCMKEILRHINLNVLINTDVIFIAGNIFLPGKLYCW